MAKVLAIHYSLTGNTSRVLEQVLEGIRAGGHEVEVRELVPVPRYPLPVPPRVLLRLLRQAVSGKWPVVPLEPLGLPDVDWDLIILGYQPWYMTPSVPIHSFLKSREAAPLQGRPVIGIVTCRAMYDRAASLFQRWVEEAGGAVVEQRVWTDQDARPTNFISLIHVLKNGHDRVQGPLRLLTRPFGVSDEALRRARNYGEGVGARLKAGPLARDGQVKKIQ